VVQVFCQICSRGVIVRNESMCKCKACGREVCRACFDREERQCIECVGERKPHDLRKPAAAKEAAEPVAREKATAKAADKRNVVLTIVGMALFATGISTSLLPVIPLWAGLVAAVGGVFLFAKGLASLLRS
jgi:hypothetical protein